MNKHAIRSVLVGAGLLALAACGSSTSGGSANAGAGSAVSASSSSSPASVAGAVLKTAKTPLGQVVVDAQGRTVYFFDKDTANSGKSACSGTCLGLWPAVTTTSDSPKVDGVSGTVATITRDDGSKQLTLNGLPLYRYAGDSAAGQTSGQGVQNIWWVVSPSGSKITAAPQQATPAY